MKNLIFKYFGEQAMHCNRYINMLDWKFHNIPIMVGKFDSLNWATTFDDNFDIFYQESETGNDVTDLTVTSHNSPYRKKKYHVKHAVDNTTLDTTTYEATYHHQCPVAADPAHFASHLPRPPMPVSYCVICF